MKIKKAYCITLFILMLVGGVIYALPYQAAAASATVWFETDQEVINEGQTFKVYLCISSDGTLGDFEGSISYNDSIIEYVQGPDCITGGAGRLSINDKGASATSDTRQYILTFKALKQGTSLIQMIEEVAAYEYSDEEPMSVSSAVFQINIEAFLGTSSNAFLSIMKISPGTLTPSFSSDVFEYQTIVSSDTEKLIISAKPEDLSSVVNVTGNTSLRDGNNEVSIIVTSSTGQELKYTIYVYKESEVLPEPTSVPLEEASNNAEWRFDVISDNQTVLIQGQYYYKLKEKTSDIAIPEGYYKSRMVINKVSINIYVREEEEASEFYLLILENEAGITSLYRYDRVEKTIQRYKGNEEAADKGVSKLEEQALFQDAAELVKYDQKINGLSFLTGLSCSISVILFIIVIILAVKLIKRRNDDFNY